MESSAYFTRMNPAQLCEAGVPVSLSKLNSRMRLLRVGLAVVWLATAVSCQLSTSVVHDADSESLPNESDTSASISASPDDKPERRSKAGDAAHGVNDEETRSTPPPKAPNATPNATAKSFEEAHQSAEMGRRAADAAFDAGRLQDAFSQAVKAWQLVRTRTDDPESQALAAALLRDVEKYGEALNQANGGVRHAVETNKPLQFE
ncbi:hypothetical protein KOR34_04880 [Posidoniimonas corsicana]|uniref:Uncharacterized protein n=1 Tax=Posidoniimonas corsicana TaxID=1938618 RepID=A0A5C5VD82_9BACT|nr:hypothetical protein KOR34_04880 [Posidoniimonas corsicana]